MVQLEEIEDDAPDGEEPLGDDDLPDMEEIPGQELSSQVLEERVWLASEMALDEPQILRDKGITHLISMGDLRERGGFPEVFDGVHEYLRADNGALITHLRKALDFMIKALKDGTGAVCVVSEEGEASAGFLIGAYMIIEKGATPEEVVAAVEEARPGCGLRDHKEFAKNLKFLKRNGIPDWA